MRLKVCLGLVLVCALSLPAFAGEQQEKKAAAPPMDPAMMEAMMKAATPGDAHKKLDAMVGNWSTEIKMWVAPGTDAITSTGVAENRWVLGGRYVEQRFNGNVMGMPFEGYGVTGYDNIQQRYFGTWMDNMSTAIMISTGKLEDDGRTWTFTGKSPDPITGKEVTIDEKVVVADNDHHMMEMWVPGPDGKNFKTIEIHYTRRK